MQQLNLEKQYVEALQKIIAQVLPQESYRAFVFGSRVSGGAREFSDIDLGILPRNEDFQLSSSLKAKLLDDLYYSTIPYKVDVIDFSQASEQFRQEALQNIYYLN